MRRPQWLDGGRLRSKLIGSIRSVRWEMDTLSWSQLSLVLLIFTLFMVLPLLRVVYEGLSFFWFSRVFSDEFFFPLRVGLKNAFPFIEFSLRTVGQIFYRLDRVRAGVVETVIYIRGIDCGVILNSLIVAVIVTIISTVLGTTLAFIMARYDFFGKGFFRTVLLVPLLSSPFVGAIGIQRMISENGVINRLLFDTLHILPFKIVLDAFAAVIFVQVLNFYAIVYLNAYSAFINIDPTLEEQAENMGSRGFHLLRTITLPLALPGIEAGAILTFILSVEDLGTPLVFQTSPVFEGKTLTVQIFHRIFTPTGLVDPIALTLSVILLAIAMVGFLMIRRYVALRGYAMISRGGAWRPRIRRASKGKAAIFYLFMTGLLFLALIPHMGVLLSSFAEYWGDTILPTRFTLRNYGVLFTNPAIANSILNSFIYSLLATILIMILGTGAAYIIDRKNIPGKAILDVLVTMPIAIPGIVIGIGFFSMFIRTPLSPLINPVPLLVMSYSIRKFPFTVRAAYAGLQQTPKELEDVSLNLGASSFTTFLRITIPLIAVNVLAGSMLSYVYAMSEVSTSLIFGEVNPTYAPMTWKIKDVLSQVGAGPFYASALGVLLMAVQLTIIIVSTKLLGQRTTALTGL